MKMSFLIEDSQASEVIAPKPPCAHLYTSRFPPFAQFHCDGEVFALVGNKWWCAAHQPMAGVSCSKCGAPSDGWPDGTKDKDGELCQMCWEEKCSEAFWDEHQRISLALQQTIATAKDRVIAAARAWRRGLEVDCPGVRVELARAVDALEAAEREATA